MEALSTHAVLVISGDTGCGKSTQVPQYILDANPDARIVVTQPRRLAARALAERVSNERGSVSGRTVGYAISRGAEYAVGGGRAEAVLLRDSVGWAGIGAWAPMRATIHTRPRSRVMNCVLRGAQSARLRLARPGSRL